MYLGSFTAGSTIYHWFNTTNNATHAPITFAGSPAVRTYKQASDVQDDSGITLTVDYDGVTGYHALVIDTSSDGTFYAAGNDFVAVVSAGTVNTISVVGKVLCQFSLV